MLVIRIHLETFQIYECSVCGEVKGRCTVQKVWVVVETSYGYIHYGIMYTVQWN